MKKLLASLLCVMMVFCMMPSMAFADEDPNAELLISDAAGLIAFAKSVNENGVSYAGRTVKLTEDIDLVGYDWTPIGQNSGFLAEKTYFRGTFDGQGHKIFNLTIDATAQEHEHYATGFFGFIDADTATIKNVTFENAFVKGNHFVGVITGFMSGTIENCKVSKSVIIGKNANEDANGDKVGGITGHLNGGNYTLKGNTVSDCSIYGNRDIGGIAGTAEQGTTLTNNNVENTKIYYITEKTYASAGSIISARTGVDYDKNSNTADINTEVKQFDMTNDSEAAVASIGNEYYYTLQDALKAAPKDGTRTTVTILKDITFTEADTCYLPLYTNVYGKYKHYFVGHVIRGQNIVLDMNGKDISMTYNSTSLPSGVSDSALIAVQDGGELTITGNGTMTITGDIMALLYAQSINSKLTIENGTFTAKVYDGMDISNTPATVEVSHGGKLYIKGGNFNNAFIDTDFNASRVIIKNKSCPDRTETGHNNGAWTELEVTGGTFQGVDPNSNCPQYNADYTWSDVDVVPAGYKSINNGDGTWTVVKEQTSSGGGHSVTIQKPTIIADDGIDWSLNILGTKVTITVKDGYELADVKLNDEGLGKVGEVSGLKTSDTVVITSVKLTDENEALIEKINNTKLVARSKMSVAKGKKAVKVTWYANDGSSLDYLEGFEVFRSSKRYEGYTQNAFFETARKAYWNTAIRSGNKYYYKVRGYVTIDGVKYYTDWSLKAWRTVK